jgi:hypothetical protein
MIYVAPHAEEATGDNAIPRALAQAVAHVAAGGADDEIVQVTRVFHTGADPMERLNNRPEFDGLAQPGAGSVLVDDVTTMGGTLAGLAHYIQANGGRVMGTGVFVNASRSEVWRRTRGSSRNWRDDMDQPFETSSESNRPLSRPTRRDTASGSVRLTKSEIEALTHI